MSKCDAGTSSRLTKPWFASAAWCLRNSFEVGGATPSPVILTKRRFSVSVVETRPRERRELTAYSISSRARAWCSGCSTRWSFGPIERSNHVNILLVDRPSRPRCASMRREAGHAGSHFQFSVSTARLASETDQRSVSGSGCVSGAALSHPKCLELDLIISYRQ